MGFRKALNKILGTSADAVNSFYEGLGQYVQQRTNDVKQGKDVVWRLIDIWTGDTNPPIRYYPICTKNDNWRDEWKRIIGTCKGLELYSNKHKRSSAAKYFEYLNTTFVNLDKELASQVRPLNSDNSGLTTVIGSFYDKLKDILNPFEQPTNGLKLPTMSSLKKCTKNSGTCHDAWQSLLHELDTCKSEAQSRAERVQKASERLAQAQAQAEARAKAEAEAAAKRGEEIRAKNNARKQARAEAKAKAEAEAKAKAEAEAKAKAEQKKTGKRAGRKGRKRNRRK